jgi:hypothetical protein
MDPLKPHTQRIIEADIAKTQREAPAGPGHAKQRIPISDQKRLLNVDPRQILTGAIEVYDDRHQRPR